MKYIFSSSFIHSRNISSLPPSPKVSGLRETLRHGTAEGRSHPSHKATAWHSTLVEQNSFTLVELLIVIGILAILTAAVVIVLNPAELLRQSRDSKRMQDLASLHSALSLLLTQNPSASLGTPNTVYVSIPDSSSVCINLSLPTLPTGYTYSCAPQTTYTSATGTGWLPIDFSQVSTTLNLSALPIDPINSSSSNLYYTAIIGSNNTYTLRAQGESTKYITQASTDGGTSDISFEQGTSMALFPPVFPVGYIKVPGNGTFSTSDFYVMKYEAKCVSLSNITQGLTTPDTGYNTYSNSTTNCTSANSRMIASTESGYPIANISQTTAATYCTSVGAHLITNNEWQTIAWNVEQQSNNWNGGVVGSSYLFSGHNDNSPALALAAGDDSNPYFGTGNSSPSNQKRTLSLSNSSTLWDLAGNAWEWTNDTIQGQNQPTGATPGWNWRAFSSTDDGSGNGGLATYGTLTQSQVGPYNSTWNANQGMGRISSDGTSGNTTTYGFASRWQLVLWFGRWCRDVESELWA